MDSLNTASVHSYIVSEPSDRTRYYRLKMQYISSVFVHKIMLIFLYYQLFFLILDITWQHAIITLTFFLYLIITAKYVVSF